MMIIDKRKIYEVIDNQKPNSVALNGPEGLVSRIQEVADNIEERYHIPAYVIGDTCWGSCDLNTHAADLLGADILFNIGHTIAMQSLGMKVVMINAYDNISFENVASVLELKAGDYVHIPAHSRHRVEATDSKHESIWLAVFYS